LGEVAYLLTASRPVAGGINGLIEHENAYFAAVPFPTPQNPPSPEDRIKIWDSLSYDLDGQTLGSWIPSEMIQDPDFTPEIRKPQLIAWPEYPQFPAQMMVEAFVVTGTHGFNHPTVQPVTSGPVTITVKDTAGHTALTLTPDLSETAEIAGYTPEPANRACPGHIHRVRECNDQRNAAGSKVCYREHPLRQNGPWHQRPLLSRPVPCGCGQRRQCERRESDSHARQRRSVNYEHTRLCDSEVGLDRHVRRDRPFGN
jgi:hypothetical protein